MTALFVLTLLVLFAVGATVHGVRTDGRGDLRPPGSHPVGRDEVPPAQWLSHWA